MFLAQVPHPSFCSLILSHFAKAMVLPMETNVNFHNDPTNKVSGSAPSWRHTPKGKWALQGRCGSTGKACSGEWINSNQDKGCTSKCIGEIELVCPNCGFGSQEGDEIEPKNIVFVSGTNWKVDFKLNGEKIITPVKGTAPSDGYSTWMATQGAELDKYKYKVFKVTTDK